MWLIWVIYNSFIHWKLKLIYFSRSNCFKKSTHYIKGPILYSLCIPNSQLIGILDMKGLWDQILCRCLGISTSKLYFQRYYDLVVKFSLVWNLAKKSKLLSVGEEINLYTDVKKIFKRKVMEYDTFCTLYLKLTSLN